MQISICTDFLKAFKNQRKHERELFISRSCARFTPDEQEQSVLVPHTFTAPFSQISPLGFAPAGRSLLASLVFRLLPHTKPFVAWKSWTRHPGGSSGIFCSSACVSYTPSCLGLISSWSSLKSMWEKWQWVALQAFSWSSQTLQVRVALVY